MTSCIWCGEESTGGVCDYHAPELEAARLRTEHTLAFHRRLASQNATGKHSPMRGLLTRWRYQFARLRAHLARIDHRKVTPLLSWKVKK